MEPPTYSNHFTIDADTGILEVKIALDREERPYLLVGIQVVMVLEFSVLTLNLDLIKDRKSVV